MDHNQDYPVYSNPGKAKILENSPTSAEGTESTTKFWASGFIVIVPAKQTLDDAR